VLCSVCRRRRRLRPVCSVATWAPDRSAATGGAATAGGMVMAGRLERGRAGVVALGPEKGRGH